MASVELPLALPVILAGIRIAARPGGGHRGVGAFFGGEGLGAYIRQGIGKADTYEVQAGALIITATAMSLDLVLWLSSKAVIPRGVSSPRRRTSDGAAATTTTTEPTPAS